jgi:hypothetical protein
MFLTPVQFWKILMVVAQSMAARFLLVLLCACLYWVFAGPRRDTKEIYRLDLEKRRS